MGVSSLGVGKIGGRGADCQFSSRFVNCTCLSCSIQDGVRGENKSCSKELSGMMSREKYDREAFPKCEVLFDLQSIGEEKTKMMSQW